jgi:DNA-binding NtrC family response regulator
VFDRLGKLVYTANAGADDGVQSFLSGQCGVFMEKSEAVLIVPGNSGASYRAEGRRLPQLDGSFLIAWRIKLIEELTEKPRFYSVQNANSLTAPPYRIDVTENEAYRKVLNDVRTLAPTDTSVLLEGERGTGKQYLAELLYQAKSAAPLISVDCQLIDGSAIKEIMSLANTADGNIKPTCWWKRLDAMSVEAQAELLGYRAVLPNFRHIASVEHNLNDLCMIGRFNPELLELFGFYRIWVPPLRERKEDIKSIASLIISQTNERIGKQIVGLTKDAFDVVYNHEWFGNIDELLQVIVDAMNATSGSLINKPTVTSVISSSKSGKNNIYNILPGMTLDDIKYEIIQYVMQEENMNQVKVAKRLGISRTTLWRELRRK